MTACDQPKLSKGMSLNSVRRALPDWQAEPLVATFSEDRRSYITIWDFIPPPESGHDRLRLTFINYELDHWGNPARGGVQTFHP